VQLESQLQDSKRFVQSQSAFFAKMVHELRTPVSGMLGMTTLLRNTLMTSEQTDMLQTVQACGDSLLLLVGNILDLSNLERNNILLAQQPFDLIDCVEEALDIASTQASQKQIELMYDVDMSDPCFPSTLMIGDSLRLRQILLNLISNAIKFTNNGGHIIVRFGPTTTASPRSSPMASDQIEIDFSVQDDGIGISNTAQQRPYSYPLTDRAIIKLLFVSIRKKRDCYISSLNSGLLDCYIATLTSTLTSGLLYCHSDQAL